MPSRVLLRKEPLTEEEWKTLLEHWRVEAKGLMERNTFPKLAEMICLRDYSRSGASWQYKRIPQDVSPTSFDSRLRRGFQTEGIFGVGYMLDLGYELPEGTNHFFGLTSKNQWVLGTLELQVTTNSEKDGKNHTCTSVKVEIASLGTIMKHVRPQTILVTFIRELKKVHEDVSGRSQKVSNVLEAIAEDLRSLPR